MPQIGPRRLCGSAQSRHDLSAGTIDFCTPTKVPQRRKLPARHSWQRRLSSSDFCQLCQRLRGLLAFGQRVGLLGDVLPILRRQQTALRQRLRCLASLSKPVEMRRWIARVGGDLRDALHDFNRIEADLLQLHRYEFALLNFLFHRLAEVLMPPAMSLTLAGSANQFLNLLGTLF